MLQNCEVILIYCRRKPILNTILLAPFLLLVHFLFVNKTKKKRCPHIMCQFQREIASTLPCRPSATGC
jgi:hypothetical protein